MLYQVWKFHRFQIRPMRFLIPRLTPVVEWDLAWGRLMRTWLSSTSFMTSTRSMTFPWGTLTSRKNFRSSRPRTYTPRMDLQASWIPDRWRHSSVLYRGKSTTTTRSAPASIQAWATAVTTRGCVVEARSGGLAKDMLGLSTTRCPFRTKREMPPIASSALRVAPAGSPEMTTRSWSPAAWATLRDTARPRARPVVLFRKFRRVVPWPRIGMTAAPFRRDLPLFEMRITGCQADCPKVSGSLTFRRQRVGERRPSVSCPKSARTRVRMAIAGFPYGRYDILRGMAGALPRREWDGMQTRRSCRLDSRVDDR